MTIKRVIVDYDEQDGPGGEPLDLAAYLVNELDNAGIVAEVLDAGMLCFGGTSAERLRGQYGNFGEHPDHLVAEWQHEVGNSYTRRGYWEWVSARIEEEGKSCELN